MIFHEVLVFLGLFGPAGSFTIVPDDRQAQQWTDDVITYDGLQAQPDWSMEHDLPDVKPAYQVVTDHIPNDGIPVFVFEHRYHMEQMVMSWGQLHTFNLTVTMRGTNNNFLGLMKAFKIVAKRRPPVAVWLLEFKNGRAATLNILARGFARTRGSTRHIVFHWSPEFCDQGRATFHRIVHAYEHVDSVFQFAYQDERLASLNSSKFKPWPLGPAWWKGWVTPPPNSTPLMTNREHLASFRGSSDTHNPWMQQLRDMFSNYNKSPDVIIEDYGKWKEKDSNTSFLRYITLLETSMYGLCLAGNNPNSYRVVETIESGAVPVIVARKGLGKCYDNWSALYGHPTGTQYPWIPKAPMVVLQSWDQLPYNVEEMLATVNTRGFELGVWYEKWRQSFIDAFASVIEGRGIPE